MILTDVNILVYAHREDLPQHSKIKSWLEENIMESNLFGLSDLVSSGFIRIVTNPKVFKKPTPIQKAFQFIQTLKNLDHCLMIEPGKKHWEIFSKLCQETKAKGNLITDAYFAALAIESNCDWISTDTDYQKFKGLKWINPLRKT